MIKKPLIERIKGLSVEVGDCWEWQGATQSVSTTPIINYKGVATGVLRAIAKDRNITLKGYVVTNSCRNPKCVNPEHAVVTTRSSLITKVSKEQRFQRRADYRLTLSKASKMRKLDDSAVAEIRASDEDRAVLAQRYGVTRGHINSIRSGHRRQLATVNVFAGLLR